MLALLVTLLGAAAAAAPSPDEAPTAAEEVDDCLACHRSSSMELKLGTGDILSLTVDAAAFGKSSHHKLACTDCHADLKGVLGEHPKRPLASKRAFAIAYSEGCKKCHFTNYTDALDGVHHARIASGKLDGAVCADCHGAHNVTSPSEPRSKISKTCGSCHQQISETYAKSVHGKSLAADENEDVPTCTECHRSHNIEDPRTGAWLLNTPQLCGNCHGNEKLMAKYKISSRVLETYLADFHGVTVRLQKGANTKPVVARCTDCHGVHDISRVTDANSKVIKANLLGTCQKCHPNAKADFPAAWMSHYEPSFRKAPLVYLIKLAYAFLIPFMIGGLALQLVLHLWRLAVNR